VITDWIDKAQQHAERELRKEPQAESDPLRDRVIRALQQIYDPEIPVNIYDLGLIYDVNISTDSQVSIKMTLTAPGCPVAQTFPGTVECAIKEVEGVTDASVELVWDPPWDPGRMSEAARLQLNML
jgi:FeS assembly SUF system protein